MCSTTFRATSALNKNYNFRKIRFYSKKTLTSNTESALSNSSSQSTDPKQVHLHAAFRKHLLNGPNLKHFFRSEHLRGQDHLPEAEVVPYLQDTKYNGAGRKVYFDVYGCQQNMGDTEIIWSILSASNYTKTETVEEADVVLLITCAIRERAEDKVWNRLEYLKGIRTQRKRKHGAETRIGILGCMAERLKEKVLEIEKSVDVIAGPDSYKDLPRLLAITGNNNTAINVLLSLDETYADVMPVRLNSDSISAFVSIMRGCDNMCTYCIVPFTRGRERSRPILSIRAEVQQLSEQGVREITLLGQNVNSYRDLSLEDPSVAKLGEATKTVPGFKTVYKTKLGGKRFAELLDTVASVDPEIRVKFTSPHPKDFPDELLQVIQSHPNIVKNLHLPAQSGNTAVLERMRRGYTREAYLNLVENIKSKLPTMTLSSDFICGFCGETDEEFADTMSLVEKVQYNTAYIYPYSMREKTTAHRRYQDNVPTTVKRDRVDSLVKLYRHHAEILNRQQIGQLQLVLVEGVSKRSSLYLAGRNDNSVKVIFPQCDLEDGANSDSVATAMKPGDYVVVQISTANSQVLKGIPLYRNSVAKFAQETRYSDRYMQYSGVI